MKTVETLSGRHVLSRLDLGLHCLPMSHRKDARLIWVKHLPKSQISTHKQCLFQHLRFWYLLQKS